MQTIEAVDANRHFSCVLKQVSQGKEFLVISRGKPVATILPVRKVDKAHTMARSSLLVRLRNQEAIGVTWTRNELYDCRLL